MATKLAFVLGLPAMLIGCGDNIAPPEPEGSFFGRNPLPTDSRIG